MRKILSKKIVAKYYTSEKEELKTEKKKLGDEGGCFC